MTIQMPSGLGEVSETRINVYPNPVKDVLYIDFSNGSEKITFELFDICGNVVREGVVNQNKIELSELKSGMYILRMNIGHESCIQRIIKN
ncbi:MAG: T9SS type A sorting domain-containing protein [Bacteroidales bacterium]|nr:T9SS type A sorting domain-containing protein [Bacteroidales bacterium]